MADAAVIYIARKGNGLAPFEKFLQSYASFRAGLAHDFVVVFKGFTPGAELQAHEQLLKQFPHKTLFVSDQGYVLKAYFAAVTQLDYRHFCFLISFTSVLDHDWLAKLYAPFRGEEVGLVSATASYESLYTNACNERQGAHRVPWQRTLLRPLRLALLRLFYEPFPNRHLRTTGCMIARSVFQRIRTRGAHTKMGGLRFESGRSSLTRQVQRMGLQAVVVGRDGRSYAPEEWPASNTFRQRNQENLLIADNRTEQYAQADLETRTHLSRLAWGEFARPE
jgi:hypothetical protein